MRRFRAAPRRLLAVLLALSTLLLALSGTALAHEHREVGPYEVVVGWVNEPALVEQPNGLDLRVARLADESPVEGLEASLQAEVSFGDRSMPLELRPRFGQPGAYISNLIPTVPGSYIFHITGQIEETPIDERFDSSDGEFSDIEPVAAMQFPEPVRVGSELQGQLAAAEAAANTTRMMALAGLATGVLGLITSAVALVRR